LCYRVDTVSSAVDKTCAVTTHKKRKKSHVVDEDSRIAADNANSTDTQTTTASKKKKKKNSGTKLPTISDERLKAYGINPKKFKYFHKKKLLGEQR